MDEKGSNEMLATIRERGKQLLKTGAFADCQFLVGIPSNRKLLAGHKLILSMASPIFERMFYSETPEENDPITIPDVQPNAFRALMECIYTDKITICSFDDICELFCVAKKFKMPYVEIQCTQLMLGGLGPETACRTYEFAMLYDEKSLLERSLKIIENKTKEVLEHPRFCDIEMTTFLAILDMDELNIDSELDLFNALVRYATARGCIPNLDTNDASTSDELFYNQQQPQPIDDDGDKSTIKVVNSLIENESIDQNLVRQAVRKIRFLTMTAQEFAEGPARSKLLTEPEALSILINIASSPEDRKLMPDRFSTLYLPRNMKFQLQTSANIFINPLSGFTRRI